MLRYSFLYQASVSKINARKRTLESANEFVETVQGAGVESFVAAKMPSAVPHVASVAAASSAVAEGSAAAPIVIGQAPAVPLPSMQPSIDTAFKNKKTQADIRFINKSTLDMAIADLCHSDNLPDTIVDSLRFRCVLRLSRLVGNDYVPPQRHRIRGDLLDLNFESYQDQNKQSLLKEASTFGISFLSDGATVKRMPLLNILAFLANQPPVTVAIKDASEHMRQGGKKDAPYIAGIMDGEIKTYDPIGELTDLFFFDGASNVQKGGQILEAMYPRTFSLHGGEHVIVMSLFFDDLSKIPEIKVSSCDRVFYIFDPD
jgi:hypothetical protein